MPIDPSQVKWDSGIKADDVQWEDQPQSLKWSDIPGKAISNIPRSAANFAGGVWQAVRHPVDTIGNVFDAAAGGLHNAMPSAVSSAIDKLDPNQESLKRAVNTANAVGGFFKNRYGSEEGIKNTLATDPVGTAADLSTLFSGGAGVAGKIPQLGKAATAMRIGAEYTNPINAATAVSSKAATLAGRTIANVVGGIGTHTGGETLQQAARSGLEGGASAKSFADNMRGNVPMTDVLETAKENIEEMGKAKAAEYRAGMAKVSGDKSILNFNNIDKAVQDAANSISFKGQVKNVKAAEVQKKIANEVDNWKSLNSADYHTPEGLDALKQKIGGIVESIPFEEKTARMVGSKIYNSVKAEIVKQAPVYADTMKGYAEASDQIKEIERALSLGNKSSADAAMRKLQSLTRNNVNSNYGNRLALAKQMEQQGGKEIMPALAGQALNSWTPRGLGNLLMGGTGLTGLAMHAPSAIPLMAAQSPRLMGEAALKAGQTARLLKLGMGAPKRAGIDPALLATALSRLPPSQQ